jgi:hypothetical protein
MRRAVAEEYFHSADRKQSRHGRDAFYELIRPRDDPPVEVRGLPTQTANGTVHYANGSRAPRGRVD